jgi:hypothetical protein
MKINGNLSISMIDVDVFLFFQLIFDNYTSIPDSSEVSPLSLSKKFSVPVNFVDDSANKGLAEELKELRGQLQSVKKQTLAMMEKTRKASEQEELALRQAKEAVAAKDAAVLEAKGAATRENSMLELMMEASTDMLGMCLQPYGAFSLFFCAASKFLALLSNRLGS